MHTTVHYSKFHPPAVKEKLRTHTAHTYHTLYKLDTSRVKTHTISQTCNRVISISTTFSFHSEHIIRSLFILICKSTSCSVALPSLLLCRQASSCNCNSCRAPEFLLLPPHQSEILIIRAQAATRKMFFTFRCCDLRLPQMALVPHPFGYEWHS